MIKKDNAMMRLLSDASMAAFGNSRQEVYLPRTQIEPEETNQEIYYNPRREELLLSMAHDFRRVGIQQPLIVYRDTCTGTYRILSGHNRFAANELAITLFPEYKGENLPCIVEPMPQSEAERIQRLILNNRQRSTTSYERMQEIAFYKSSYETLHHRECPREELQTALAASNSEITRYLKIYTDLVASLMEAFREGQLATSVAHTLSGMAYGQQEKIAALWDFGKAPLTASDLTRLTHTLWPEEKPEKPAVPLPASIGDGLRQLSALSGELSHMAATLPQHTGKRKEQAILKQIAAELSKLEALRQAVKELQEAETP